MKEQIKKALYTGLGFASYAYDKAKVVGEDIAEEFNLSHEEGKKFADEINERVKEEKERITKLIDDKVDKASSKVNSKLLDEINSLKKRLETIEEKLKNK